MRAENMEKQEGEKVAFGHGHSDAFTTGTDTTKTEKVSQQHDPMGTGVRQDMGNMSEEERKRRELNLKLANPLGGYSMSSLGDMGEQYCRENCLGEDDDIRAFRLGAQVAKDPLNFQQVAGLTDAEKQVFADEITHKWRQPKKLYLVIFLCSLCAAVQGMGRPSPSFPPPSAPWRLVLTSRHRRNSSKRRPNLLLPTLRHLRPEHPTLNLASRPHKLRSLPLLRPHRLLAHRPFQQLVRPPRHHLPYLFLLRRSLLLARLCEHLVAHVRCSVLPGLWYWTEECDGADICCGDGAACY